MPRISNSAWHFMSSLVDVVSVSDISMTLSNMYFSLVGNARYMLCPVILRDIIIPTIVCTLRKVNKSCDRDCGWYKRNTPECIRMPVRRTRLLEDSEVNQSGSQIHHSHGPSDSSTHNSSIWFLYKSNTVGTVYITRAVQCQTRVYIASNTCSPSHCSVLAIFGGEEIWKLVIMAHISPWFV